MASTNQKFIKKFKPGKSKQQAAEINFLQAVQNWYADIEIGLPYSLANRLCVKTVRYSNQWPQYDQLLYWYTYGFNRGVVTITFEWFKEFAKGSDVHQRFAKRQEAATRNWSWRTLPKKQSRYSGNHHDPKSDEWREEQRLKKEWRKRKDKRRNHWHRGPGPDDKRLRAKCHRSFRRQNIHRENWDAFHATASSNWEYKFNLDPWDTWA